MGRLPSLLASSVIRGTHLGQSHGGLYLVDLERGTADLKLDWNSTRIDIAGRGGDRGLRGIAFHDDHILVAANAELLVLDQAFEVIDAFSNPYLQHCHEITVVAGRVLLTSTGFDSVLMFDLRTRQFAGGWHLAAQGDALELRPFDPRTNAGPAAGNRFHLNSISATDAGFWFSGLDTPGLLHANGNGLSLAAPLPPGTHNAQPLGDGVLYNDTAGERVCYRSRGRSTGMAVPDFPADSIVNADQVAASVARARFARGLCVLHDGLVAGGSSPSTVAVYDVTAGRRLLLQNISMDICNAVHGLALWPYS
jgi:hypothetical protein